MRYTHLAIICLLTTTLAITAQANNDDKPKLTPVASVDLKRYMGSWYEIARYPNRFQKDTVGVIANYTLKKNGDITVVNSGYKKSLDGKKTSSKAKAWVVDENTNAKWHVRFIWPFKADYWIIDLCENYTFAVVGQPSRDHLWILSRTPQMDDETYEQIRERLVKQGYDPAKLELTKQPKE